MFTAKVRQGMSDALNDLDHASIRKYWDMALFLDRPLGVYKTLRREVVDRTPLFASSAFSRSIAAARLAAWQAWGWLSADRHQQIQSALAKDDWPGVRADALPLPA